MTGSSIRFTRMRIHHQCLARRLSTAGAIVLIGLIAACGDRSSDTTAGQKLDRAIERSKDATTEAVDKAAELGKSARDKTDAYLQSPQVKQDAAAVEGALRNAGRTLKSDASDAITAAAVSAALARDPQLSALRIDVDAHDGVVRLSGPAPNAQARSRAETLAKGVDGVTAVDDQLTVSTAK